MASPATIDFDRLLAPIADAQPAGVNLRADASPTSPYYALKDARKAARAKERSGAIEDAEVPDTRAEWRPIAEQAQALLAEQSKDVEILAWLIEALARIDGFAGLRDGFHLARELLEGFWESFYPTPDASDLEDRVAPLAGLNGQDAEGTLIVPIRNIALTAGSSEGPFAAWHYQQAVALQQVTDPEVKQKRIAAGAVTLERIEKARTETEPAFFRSLYQDLDECQAAFAKLGEFLDERCGVDVTPPSSNIRNELKACMDALQYIGKAALEEPPAEESEGDVDFDDQSVEGETSAGSGSPNGHLRDREQAFRTLLQVADFFRKTEPHSPLSYSIEQIVRWGRLPLPELLEELIAEDGARDHYFRLAGIRRPEDSG